MTVHHDADKPVKQTLQDGPFVVGWYWRKRNERTGNPEVHGTSRTFTSFVNALDLFTEKVRDHERHGGEVVSCVTFQVGKP